MGTELCAAVRLTIAVPIRESTRTSASETGDYPEWSPENDRREARAAAWSADAPTRAPRPASPRLAPPRRRAGRRTPTREDRVEVEGEADVAGVGLESGWTGRTGLGGTL